MDIAKNERFLRQLKRHEGKVLNKKGQHKTYFCSAGKLTIGYGHNLEASPITDIHEGTCISEKRATAILLEDCSKFEKQLDLHIPWWRELDDPRAAVILNMAFNMGVYAKDKNGKISGLMSFKRFLSAVNAEQWEKAASEMLDSRWATQVKSRAVELSRQMASGKWQE